ncbi:hypothetical protein OA88_02345 [Flavobacterium sp. JRM]|nr:hypothetical protein OA88_02345 [Flavobacterium sp. JRM]
MERGLNGFAKAKTRSRSVGTDFLFIVLKSVFIRVFIFVNQFNPRPFLLQVNFALLAVNSPEYYKTKNKSRLIKIFPCSLRIN